MTGVQTCALPISTLRKHFRLRGYAGGVFFYERDRSAPRPGQIYVQNDLLWRWALGLDTVSSAPAQPNRIRGVRGRRDEVRWSLDLNSSTLPAVSWKVTPENRALLSFSLVRAEWNNPANGYLTVSIDNEVVATEPAREQDPFERWRPVEVDLSRWTGKTVTLKLEVHAQQIGRAHV